MRLSQGGVAGTAKGGNFQGLKLEDAPTGTMVFGSRSIYEIKGSRKSTRTKNVSLHIIIVVKLGYYCD